MTKIASTLDTLQGLGTLSGSGSFDEVCLSGGNVLFMAYDTANHSALYLWNGQSIVRVVGSGDALGDGNTVVRIRDLSPNALSGGVALFRADISSGVAAIYVATPVSPASPTITGVTSASDFGGQSSFAPGSWLEIKGSGLASATRTWAGSDFVGANAPTSLAGVSVQINGRSAFVYYVSPTQVNAQAPADASAAGPALIQVTTAAGPSNSFSFPRAETAPGLLAPSAFNVGGKQYLAALYPDTRS